MTQSGAVFLGPTTVQIELPACGDEALPGVAWGSIDAFPTPAYWAYQVIARRVGGASVRHRLGQTLAEEVAACLLGGHGIPASVGMAAFRKLKSLDMLASASSEEELLQQLTVPLAVNGRPVKYRFARQKARYLDAALKRLTAESPPTECGRALRDWLVDLPGIGFKTASWVARNWLDADDVAILDIHILRAGALGGFFDRSLTVERDYKELEAQFIRFSRAIGVRPSELDAVIWFEMMSSPATVSQLLGGRRGGDASPHASSRRRAHERGTNPHQARLIE